MKKFLFPIMCMLILAVVITASFGISNGSSAFAETPPAEKTFTSYDFCEIGDNLRGKTVYCDGGNMLEMAKYGVVYGNTDPPDFTGDPNSVEDKYNFEGPKVWRFKENRTDFVTLSSGGPICAGIFSDVFALSHFIAGDTGFETFTFPDDKDYILEVNSISPLYYSASTQAITALNLTSLKGYDMLKHNRIVGNFVENMIESYPNIPNMSEATAVYSVIYDSGSFSEITFEINGEIVSLSLEGGQASTEGYVYFLWDSSEKHFVNFIFDEAYGETGIGYLIFFENATNVIGYEFTDGILNVTIDDSQPIAYAKGALLDEPEPVKDGYRFVGYKTADGALFNSAEPLTGDDIVLTSEFEALAVDVTFETETPFVQKVDLGAKVIEPEAPTAAAGYHFVEWCTDEALTTAYDFDSAVTEPMSLYPKFEINTYAVTFELTEDVILNVNHGSKVSAPAVPTAETGYHFVEWCSDETLTTAYDFESVVTSAMSLYPKFEINTYAVTFELTEDVILNVNHGSKVSAPAVPTAETGYHFVEWCSDETLTTAYDFDSAVTSTMSLYPKFAINTYTVTFELAEDVILNVNHGSKVSAPAVPTAETGYHFVEWCTDEALTTAYDFDSAVTEPMSLYPKFEINTYAVTFELTEDVILNVNHGSKVSAPAAPTAVAGYHFVEWCSDETLTTAYDFDSAVTSTMRLYPKFAINTYAVTFELAEDVILNVNHGSKVSAPAAPTAETGYHFVEWCTDEALTTAYDFDSAVTEPMSLYPKFEINTYAVTMKNGETSAEISVNYGAKAEAPKAPEKEGYIFVGWKTEANEVFDFSKEVYGDIELTAEFEPTAKTMFVDWMKPNHKWAAPTMLSVISIAVFVILAIKRH